MEQQDPNKGYEYELQVIDVDVSGLGSGTRFERSGIASAHYASQNTDFEKRNELLLGVDLAAGCGGGLHAPCGAQDAIAVEGKQAGELARTRCFGRRLQGEHLHMAFADLQLIAVPRNWILHDLAVYSGIAAELVVARPVFKVEEIAEELKDIVLRE